MNNPILVLGAGGMLGHKVFQRLSRDFTDTYGTLHSSTSSVPFGNVPMFQTPRVFSSVDVSRVGEFHALLTQLTPAVIVNCVGVIKQRPAAESATVAIRLNSLLPHELVEISSAWGGRVIHFSTDCVFSGRRGNYNEDDVPDAEDLYGRSKFLGEVAGPRALTIRTSIVGRELKQHQSLLDWFLSQNHKTVSGFARVMFSGVTTNHLADVVATIISREAPLSGLYHLASAPISKYQLLVLFRQFYNLDIEIVPDDQFVCDRTLNGARFEAAMDYRCAPWRQLISELAADPTPYEEWLHYETV